MKLLLKQDIEHLGLVGDVVDVKEGYARNYLIPHDLAIPPTQANLKQLEEAKARAAEQRRIRAEQRKAAAERLSGKEITIKAAANSEGGLYGSVGPREIAAALRHEGHTVETDQVELHHPIRHLDNVMVPVRFADDVVVEVKVWVVRESGSEEFDEDDQDRTEALTDGDDTEDRTTD